MLNECNLSLNSDATAPTAVLFARSKDVKKPTKDVALMDLTIGRFSDIRS
jgi:hypothetical protein